MTFFQDNFTPYSKVIISISNTSPAVVTTYGDHGYDDGLVVRLVVPKNCGMQQITGQIFEITKVADDSFSIPVDASNFDSFAYASLDQIAQVVPVGENPFSLTQAEKNAKNITPEF